MVQPLTVRWRAVIGHRTDARAEVLQTLGRRLVLGRHAAPSRARDGTLHNGHLVVLAAVLPNADRLALLIQVPYDRHEHVAAFRVRYRPPGVRPLVVGAKIAAGELVVLLVAGHGLLPQREMPGAAAPVRLLNIIVGALPRGPVKGRAMSAGWMAMVWRPDYRCTLGGRQVLSRVAHSLFVVLRVCFMRDGGAVQILGGTVLRIQRYAGRAESCSGGGGLHAGGASAGKPLLGRAARHLVAPRPRYRLRLALLASRTTNGWLRPVSNLRRRLRLFALLLLLRQHRPRVLLPPVQMSLPPALQRGCLANLGRAIERRFMLGPVFGAHDRMGSAEVQKNLPSSGAPEAQRQRQSIKP
mmetsp:Transcript_6166/g.17245  ORF Transcript_6166/g.17245 Transcript_6166/m.17245 type:complete len:355 (-) Transcript_6166:225-1289(-)